MFDSLCFVLCFVPCCVLRPDYVTKSDFDDLTLECQSLKEQLIGRGGLSMSPWRTQAHVWWQRAI